MEVERSCPCPQEPLLSVPITNRVYIPVEIEVQFSHRSLTACNCAGFPGATQATKCIDGEYTPQYPLCECGKGGQRVG